jgi:hypothetical protein
LYVINISYVAHFFCVFQFHVKLHKGWRSWLAMHIVTWHTNVKLYAEKDKIYI